MPGRWADRGSRHERGYGYRWVKLREAVMRRDRGLCQLCLERGRITAAREVHHVIPKAQGGTDDLDNLTATCSPCHRDADMRARGMTPRREVGADGYPLD